MSDDRNVPVLTFAADQSDHTGLPSLRMEVDLQRVIDDGWAFW